MKKRLLRTLAVLAIVFGSMYGIATFAPTIMGGGAAVNRNIMVNPGRYAHGAPEKFDGPFLYHRAWEAFRDWHMKLSDGTEMAKFVEWEHKFDTTDDLKTEEGTDRAIRLMRDSLGQRFDYVLNRKQTKSEAGQVRSDLVGIGMPVGIKDAAGLLKAAGLAPGATEEQVEKAMIIGPGHQMFVPAEPFEGGPAFGNIRKDDVIFAVDGEKLDGLTLNAAVGKIRGTAGTKVDVTVIRQENGESVKHTFTFTRTPIVRHAVHYKQKDGKAIITIDDFMADNAADDFDELIARADANNVGVVIDVRNNGGGALQAVLQMLARITPRGELLVQVERVAGAPALKIVETHVENGFMMQVLRLPGMPPRISQGERPPLLLKANKPVVVLINGRSASASEILSGSCQGNGRCTVVGTPSIGKGVGQIVLQLPFGRSLHVTSFEFLPAGVKSDWIGVIPDIEVPFTKEDAEAGRDPQMDAALAEVDRKVTENKKRATRTKETFDEHHALFDKILKKQWRNDALPVGATPSPEDDEEEATPAPVPPPAGSDKH